MERTIPLERPPVAATVHRDMVRAIEPAVEENLGLLTPIDKAWQPSDYLPDLETDGWQDEVAAFRQRAQAIPDDLLVVLVGDMITEEALPSYSVALNGLVRDDQGDSPAPWARWLRGWTAEENRHGDLLNGYLRLSGRVDMRAVEQTTHALIANGFNPGELCDPYNLLVYSSFQERATRISHGNVGKLAGSAGDPHLARICSMIASDEARHETFYARLMGQVLDRDPVGGILAMRSMLRATIAMPGRLMDDGGAPGLFDRFAIVAQRTGVYTVRDYASIIDHLVGAWGIAGRSVSGEAAQAQEEVCRQAERHLRLADRISATLTRQPSSTFRWIHGRRA